MSAVRNLHGHETGGRRLRIGVAEIDPLLEGKTTQLGQVVNSGATREHWRERVSLRNDSYDNRDNHRLSSFLKVLPPGVSLPTGLTALDSINTTLASIGPTQLNEMLAQMKVNDVPLTYA